MSSTSEPADGSLFDLNPEIEGASAFIQWRGTDACVDVYCDCGQQSHVHGYFVYYVRCSKCGATYMMPHTAPLYRVPDHLLHEVPANVTHMMDE